MDETTPSTPSPGQAPPRGPARHAEAARVVDELCSPASCRLDALGRRYRTMLLPSRHKVLECAEELRSVMFPATLATASSATTRCATTSARRWTACCTRCKRRSRMPCSSSTAGSTSASTPAPARPSEIIDTFLACLPDPPPPGAGRPGVLRVGPRVVHPRSADVLLSQHPGDDQLPPGPRAVRAGRAVHPAHRHRARAQHDRDRHPSRGPDRRELLHRPWHGRGHRADADRRRPRAAVPGRDAGRQELPA